MLFTIPSSPARLIRAFAWRLVLGRTGIVNNVLDRALASWTQPVEWLLFSDFAVVIGMVAAYLPLAVIPMVLVFARIESSVIRASEDLGAGFWTTFSPHRPAPRHAGSASPASCSYSSSPRRVDGDPAPWRRRRIFSIAIMINDVMRVVNFPLAFAIATVSLFFCLAIIILADRALGLSRMFEDLGA